MNFNIYSFLLATLAVPSALGDAIAAETQLRGSKRRLQHQNLLSASRELCNGPNPDGICWTLDTYMTGLFQPQVNIRLVKLGNNTSLKITPILTRLDHAILTSFSTNRRTWHRIS